MLNKIKILKGYRLDGLDGEIGRAVVRGWDGLVADFHHLVGDDREAPCVAVRAAEGFGDPAPALEEFDLLAVVHWGLYVVAADAVTVFGLVKGL